MVIVIYNMSWWTKALEGIISYASVVRTAAEDRSEDRGHVRDAPFH